MFGLRDFFIPSLFLQALAIIHFVRRRPDTFWLWIIIMGSGLGAIVYIFVEVLPDMDLLRGQVQVFGRRKRIAELEGIVHDNPSAGNYEELALLYLDNKEYKRAKECYDRSISARTDSPDPFYRRAICEIELGEFAAALDDLKRVTAKDPNYDFRRAQGLLAHAYAKTGNAAEADRIFATVTEVSTLSETMYNYAEFLLSQGRNAEAREWAQRILSKKPAMPNYLRRRERPWFRKASGLLKRIPAQG